MTALKGWHRKPGKSGRPGCHPTSPFDGVMSNDAFGAEPEGHHNNGERRFRVERQTPLAARSMTPCRDRRHRAPKNRPSNSREQLPAPDRRNPAARRSAALRRHRTPDRGCRRRTAGDAARAEAVDGKGHIPPGTQPIGDPHEMPGNANAAVQYDNRRERTTAVGRIVAVELYRRGDLPACVPGGWEIRPGRRPTRRPHRAMRQAPSQAGKFAKRASSGDAERVQSASPAAMARYERGSSTKTSRGVVPLSRKIP
jgi:hypothetical protein